MSQPVALYRDGSLRGAPGRIVKTIRIDIDLSLLGSPDRRAVGDIGDKWREIFQRDGRAAWPPPRGHWRNHGRFSVDDGRHEFVAALHGHSECFVAWVECRS